MSGGHPDSVAAAGTLHAIISLLIRNPQYEILSLKQTLKWFYVNEHINKRIK